MNRTELKPTIEKLSAKRRAGRVRQWEVAPLIKRSPTWISLAENGLIPVTEQERKAYETAVMRLLRKREAA